MKTIAPKFATAAAGETRQERDAARAEATAPRELAAAAREALARAEATASHQPSVPRLPASEPAPRMTGWPPAVAAMKAQASQRGQDAPAPAPLGLNGKGKVPTG